MWNSSVWILALVVGAAGIANSLGTAYPDGPLPGHTGGFGEPTCHACHFEWPINDPAGSLHLSGISGKRFVPGQRYEVAVELQRPDMQLAGFQLAVRFAVGTRAGQQAGVLAALDSMVTVIASGEPMIQYARHTLSGSDKVMMGVASWAVEWIAPQEAVAVVIHVAANAANRDASEFGDYIYTDSLILTAAER